MVTSQSLTKQLDSFSLGPVEFSLPAGYILGLVGENGSGKTTLLRLLCGLYTGTSGSITLFGQQYDSAEAAIKNEIGTVFQEEFFDSRFTLLENANRFGKFYSRYEQPLFLQYASRFGLDVRKKAGRLSRGEGLKFSLAFALSHRPRLLLLDEPSANFDEDFHREFIAVLREFTAEGENSVILSTHMTEELETLADYLLILQKGRQLAFGDIETVRRRWRIAAGEEYKLKLLPKDRLLYLEKGELGCRALVKNSARPFDPELKVWEPSIAELLYFFVKGDAHKWETM